MDSVVSVPYSRFDSGFTSLHDVKSASKVLHKIYIEINVYFMQDF